MFELVLTIYTYKLLHKYTTNIVDWKFNQRKINLK